MLYYQKGETIMKQSERKLIRHRQRLLDKLARLNLLLHASYLERFSTCIRSHCECHKGKKHGPRAYLAIYHGKRQRQVYVPQAQQAAVQRGLQQYKEMEEIVLAITNINLQLMRARCLELSETNTCKRSTCHE